MDFGEGVKIEKGRGRRENGKGGKKEGGLEGEERRTGRGKGVKKGKGMLNSTRERKVLDILFTYMT